MRLSDFMLQIRETELLEYLDTLIKCTNNEDDKNELIEFMEQLADKLYSKQEQLIGPVYQEDECCITAAAVPDESAVYGPDEWGEFTH